MALFNLFDPELSVHVVRVLAHFLWQGLVIALLAAAAAWWLRKASAQTRYLVHLGALMLMVLCLPVTSLLLRWSDAAALRTVADRPAEAVGVTPAAWPSMLPEAPPLPATRPAGPAGEPTAMAERSEATRMVDGVDETPPDGDSGAASGRGPVVDRPSSPMTQRAGWSWHVAAPYLLIAYLIGVAVMLLRLAGALADGYRLRRHLKPVDDARLLELVARQSRAIGLRSVPVVAYCQRVVVPALVGVVRPMILLPACVGTNMSLQEIEAIVTHELVHLRRWDPLVNLIQRIIECLLFFHPGVWYVSRQIRLEREYCCDDLVLRAGHEQVTYLRSLVRAAEMSFSQTRASQARLSTTFASLGDRPSRLRGRILRLLGDAEDSRVRLTRNGAMAFAAVLLAGVVLGLAAISVRAEAQTGNRAEEVGNGVSAGSEQVEAQHGHADGESTRQDHAGREMLARVVDAQKKAIAGASVWVRILGQDGQTYEAAPDGTVAVPAPADDSTDMLVVARAEGYVPLGRRFRNADQHDPIPKEYTAELVAAVTVGGVIQDEQGEPIEGATVDLYAQTNVYAGPQTFAAIGWAKPKSDAEGRWRCSEMPADFHTPAMRLEHPDYVSDGIGSTARAPSVARLRDQTSVRVMRKGVPVAGTVIDPEGNAIAGAAVAQGRSRFGTSYPVTRTDDQGRYRFPHCNAGRMVLTVVAPGWAPDVRRIAVGPELGPVDFRLQKGRTIRIRVIDKQGKSIGRVKVTTDTWRGYRSLRDERIPGYTDDDGNWAWEWAPEDAIEYNVHKRGYTWIMDKPLTPREEPYVLTLYPVLEVSGEVVDAETGKPIERFSVLPGIYESRWPEVAWEEHNQAVGRNGRYKIAFDFPREGHLLRVEADGYLPAVSRQFKDQEGRVTYDFRLQKGSKPSSAVKLPDGKPAQGATVVVAKRNQLVSLLNGRVSYADDAAMVRTGADGRFELNPQQEPFHLVILHDQGYAVVTDEQLGALQEIKLQLWARLEGTLRRGTQPWANERLWLRVREDGDPKAPHVDFRYELETGAEGGFVFDRVQAGRAELHHSMVDGPRFAEYRRELRIDLVGGETARLTIGGEGGPLVGRLIAPEGYAERIDWSEVIGSVNPKMPKLPYPEELENQGPEAYRKWEAEWRKTEESQRFAEKTRQVARRERHFDVRTDGSFRVENVEPGEYWLGVYLREGAVKGPKEYGVELSVAKHQISVPAGPGGVTDEPFDLGTLQLELEKPLAERLAGPVRGLEDLPKKSEGGLRDHVDLLRWMLNAYRQNRQKIQTWQGRAAIEREGQIYTGERYRQKESVRFAFDRQRNALRWNWELEEAVKLVEGQESPRAQPPLSAGMRTSEAFYRLRTDSFGREPQRPYRLDIYPPGQERVEPYAYDFDPMWYLTQGGQELDELLGFYIEEADNPALGDCKVTRDGHLVTFEVASGTVVNRYTFNLALAANLVAFFGSSGSGDSLDTWDSRWTYEDHEGIWVPKTWTRVTAGQPNSGARRVTFVENLVNGPLDEQAFSLKSLGVEPGDTVRDRRSDEEYAYQGEE